MKNWNEYAYTYARTDDSNRGEALAKIDQALAAAPSADDPRVAAMSAARDWLANLPAYDAIFGGKPSAELILSHVRTKAHSLLK